MTMPSAVPSSGLGPVVVAPCTDAADWDAYVSQAPGATGYHLWGWRDIFDGVFHHQCEYLAARRDGRIVGVLPLVLFASALFGRFVVSLPFVNYGGVVADDDVAAQALVDEAGRVARAHRAKHLELRHDRRRFPALAAKTHKVAMLRALPADADTLWNDLDRKVRNQVRKAEKHQLTAFVAGREALDDFYDVFAVNMRDLGTPVYPPRLFDQVLRTFKDRARLVIVRHGERPVAGGFTFRWRDRTEIPWASTLREYNAMSANNLLYWTVLKSAIADGSTTFDFGRSTPNEGTFHFKKQWGGSPVELCWEYDVVTGSLPDQSPKNPKFQMAIRAWQQLPVGLATALGPHLVRGIP